MKRAALIVIMFVIILTLSGPVAGTVMPVVTHDDAKVVGEREKFVINIHLNSNQNATYRVHIKENKDFDFIGHDGNKEEIVLDGGNYTFIFSLQTAKNIDKGRYIVEYDVYMNEVLTNTSSLNVDVSIRNDPEPPVSCQSVLLGVSMASVPLLVLIVLMRKVRPWAYSGRS